MTDRDEPPPDSAVPEPIARRVTEPMAAPPDEPAEPAPSSSKRATTPLPIEQSAATSFSQRVTARHQAEAEASASFSKRVTEPLAAEEPSASSSFERRLTTPRPAESPPSESFSKRITEPLAAQEPSASGSFAKRVTAPLAAEEPSASGSFARRVTTPRPAESSPSDSDSSAPRLYARRVTEPMGVERNADDDAAAGDEGDFVDAGEPDDETGSGVAAGAEPRGADPIGADPRGARQLTPDEAVVARSRELAAEARRRRPDPWESKRIDWTLRISVILVVLALGAVGIALPHSVLRGGVAWLAFLFFVLSGWGYFIVRIRGVADPDFGLRAAWGAAGYIAVTGVLVAIGVCSNPAILALIAVGALGFVWRELVAPVPSWQRIRAGVRYLRDRRAMGVLIILLVALAMLQMLGAVAALDRNPWDDDLAYTPMIKRLLDDGNLVEPFSFRRMSAYGGQTVLGALAAARGTLANVHLVDKALFFGIALLIVAGKAKERRAQPVWIVMLMLVLLLLPETSINTAAHWTGVAMFLALYRAVARDHWSIVGLVGAAACTLRQNYIIVVVLFVGIVLFRRLLGTRRVMSWREAWQIEKPRWRLVLVVAIAAIAAWWIAAFISNRTFLFPYFEGTWNHDLSLVPDAMTWTQELASFVWACIDTTPIVVVPILFALLVFTDDDRIGRPLRSFFIAAVIGFVLLAHGFAGTEPFHLWRYAFGFGVALTAVFVLEVGAEHERSARLAPLGRWLLLGVLALQLLVARGAVPKRFGTIFTDLREAIALDRHGDPTARIESRRYAAMQAAVPSGAKLAVLVDDPAYLDFTRNAIANLDTPGFASPGSQLPAFRGAEPLRAYLVDQGYRYLAFVRSERSRYFFRREFWLWRIFHDSELFQIMSAYALDTIDSFTELATTTKVLHDIDGLVVLDLASPVKPASINTFSGSEPVRRSEWFRQLAEREGLRDAWSLVSRHDLRFEDGVANLQFVDAAITDPRWFEVAPAQPPSTLRGTPIRALFRRAHLRVRGTTDMRLQMKIAIALNAVYSRPRIDLSLNGKVLASVVADDTGHYAIDLAIPERLLAGGWRDLYLVFSTINEPDAAGRELRVARLESVEWGPVP